MGSVRGWSSGTLTLFLAAATAAGAAAQDAGDAEVDRERCVCVDVEEVRERVREGVQSAREGMQDAREEMERARRRIERTHDRLENRARLGVGIDHDQGARWDSVGVLVTDVPDEGPAAEAGIESGDVIVRLGGRSLTEPLSDPEDEDDLDDDRSRPVQRLALLVRKHEPGDEVEVGYLRDGEEASATVELAAGPGILAFAGPGARPPVVRFRRGPGAPGGPDRGFEEERFRGLGPSGWSQACAELAGYAPPIAGGPCVAGLRVTGLNPSLGAYFGTEEGVLVTEVAGSSPFGLRPGDVILAVGEREVRDAADLRRILVSYEEGEEVRLRVRRSGDELEVTDEMP